MTELGHVVYYVKNLEASLKFYHAAVGLEVSGKIFNDRAALLTGRHHWMIGPAGTHGSTFPIYYQTFVDVLEDAGYKVGFTGKGWGPGDWLAGGREKNPAGVEYNELKLKKKLKMQKSPQKPTPSFFSFVRRFDQYLIKEMK